MHVRTRLVASAICFACIAGWSAPAAAQRLGSYSGTTADGNAINFSVGVDSTTGKHAITFLGLNFTTLCAGSGEQVGEGLGAGFSNGVDIAGGGQDTTVVVNLLSLYVNAALSFHDTTIKGKIYSIIPAFNPAVGTGAKPTVTQLCTSPKQAFTATFVSPNIQHGSSDTVTLTRLPVGVK